MSTEINWKEIAEQYPKAWGAFEGEDQQVVVCDGFSYEPQFYERDFGPDWLTHGAIKVLAMYLGQQYYSNNKYQPFFNKVMLGNIAGIAGSRHKLLLRPISSLTDEECFEVMKMFDTEETAPSEDMTDFVKNWLLDMGTKYPFRMGIKTTDHLRSIGIDLPTYLLGGKTLKEAGLAVYKDDMV